MKKIILYCCFVISFGLLLQGCAYGPHIVDIPLMSKKHDAQISVGISSPALPAISISAAYAPIDNFAIQVQGEYLFYDQYHTQLALGYFQKFTNNTVLENYYGAELGNLNYSTNTRETNSLIGNYTIAFTQINYGKIKLKAHGEVGGGLKIGYQYGEFLDQNYFSEYGSPVNKIYYHGIVLEPTIFYRFGWEHLRIGLQLSGCYAPSFGEYYLPYSKINGGLSFIYKF